MAVMTPLVQSRARVKMGLGLSFDDVLLVPKRGSLEKRADADISSQLVWGITLDVPIVSAPMQSVTERHMAMAMRQAGGYGIIHRFMTIEEQLKQFEFKPTPPGGADYAPWAIEEAMLNIGAAIGINEGYERWQKLYDVGVRIFCLDVAHAHHDTVMSFIDNAKGVEDSSLIVGNIATAVAAYDLVTKISGVSAIKVGIGPGAACTTRAVTGFGVPQLTAIMDVAEALENRPTKIIADGGIKNSGDIVKALAAGADTVMLGRLLAGADESPHPGLYWGMASHRVNGHHAPEGVEGVVDRTGPVGKTIKELAWGIRSGISYGGGSSLEELRRNAEFIRVSPQGMGESGVRI